MEPIKKKRPIQAILMSNSYEQWDNIVNGNKEITIRTGYRDYVPGLLMIVNPEINMCVKATLTDVKYYLAKDVPKKDCIADGFSDLEDMITGMRQYYPEFNPDSEVTVIKWKDVQGKMVDTVRKIVDRDGRYRKS